MGQKFAIFNTDGFPNVFYDDEIHENIPQEAISITDEQWMEFIENQGQRKWNFQTNQVEVYTPPLPTIDDVKKQKKKQILNLEKERLQKVLDTYDYLSFADVQFYASQNDTEAQTILSWYQTYDDSIWQYIDNDLQTITTVNDLLELDIESIEEKIYQDSIKASPLP